jgi:WhiB family transcriptional regulator, redox-sensing transcriptional regulator
MAVNLKRPPAYYMLAAALPRGGWLRRAACTPKAADAWWPVTAEPDRDGRRALRICSHCPVIRDCGQWAIDNDMTDGIWGGMRPAALRRLVESKRGRRRPGRPRKVQVTSC